MQGVDEGGHLVAPPLLPDRVVRLRPSAPPVLEVEAVEGELGVAPVAAVWIADEVHVKAVHVVVAHDLHENLLGVGAHLGDARVQIAVVVVAAVRLQVAPLVPVEPEDLARLSDEEGVEPGVDLQRRVGGMCFLDQVGQGIEARLAERVEVVRHRFHPSTEVGVTPLADLDEKGVEVPPVRPLDQRVDLLRRLETLVEAVDPQCPVLGRPAGDDGRFRCGGRLRDDLREHRDLLDDLRRGIAAAGRRSDQEKGHQEPPAPRHGGQLCPVESH